MEPICRKTPGVFVWVGWEPEGMVGDRRYVVRRETEAMERTAECHCGSLRAIVAGEPESVDLCHCKACQRRTGTVFHFGSTYLKDRVRLQGARHIYERGTDSGNRIRFYFCPNCGSNLYWESDRNPAICGITVGSFADPNFPLPSYSQWEESKHGWRRRNRDRPFSARSATRPAAPISSV